MKKTIYLFAISFALVFAACSNTEQDITSPFASQIEKTAGDVQSYPYKLYQTFPELKSASVTWHNEKGGLVINIDDRSARMNTHLFATLEFVDVKGAVMAFLGSSEKGSYFISGLDEKEIKGIKLYNYVPTFSAGINVQPYSQSQLFNGLGVKGWSDGGSYAKVNSQQFPLNMDQLYGQLIASEGTQLIFLGKPQSEGFDFPKSEKLNLKDIKLFTLQR
ncbi:MAG: hypothetical protein IH620_01730 [Ignavibacterium sp.]|nr:hypothetical protein [Ignavibacterium sp.]